MTSPSVKFIASCRVRNHEGYVYRLEVFAANEAEAADRARAYVEQVYGPDVFESLVSLEAVNEGAI